MTKGLTPRRALAWLAGLAFAAYALLATAVCLRQAYRPAPEAAAMAFLGALQARDTASIYLYAEALGAQLDGLAKKSGMSADGRRHLQAKDYARWKAEFERGQGALEGLMRREANLVRSEASVEPASPARYRAVVQDGEGESLESYRDVPGEVYHRYARLSYAAPQAAPPVAALDNVQTGKQRKLREVVLRLEVRPRPALGWLRALSMQLDALDGWAQLVPFRGWFKPVEPAEAWAVRLCLAVDKTSLVTF
jgi:hypothetical protein